MIVSILLIAVAIINTIEALKAKKSKLIFRICNYWIFPAIYFICYLFTIFEDINLYLYGIIVVIIEKIFYLIFIKNRKSYKE